MLLFLVCEILNSSIFNTVFLCFFECDLAKIKADIEERDYRDMNREHSPLKQAEDAILVDSSYMTIEEVIERIISICDEKK